MKWEMFIIACFDRNIVLNSNAGRLGLIIHFFINSTLENLFRLKGFGAMIYLTCFDIKFYILVILYQITDPAIHYETNYGSFRKKRQNIFQGIFFFFKKNAVI